MDSKLWQMWKSFWNAAPGSPAAIRSASEWAGYPQTFAKLPHDARLARPKLFEPALKQYLNGFRLGEPTFRDPEIGRQWFAARRRVLDHLAQLVGASAWKDSLLLRGSYLLKQWLGDAAREPGDLDWVIQPARTTWQGQPDWAIFNGLGDLVRRNSEVGPGIRITEVAVDEIWNYDRIPGRRMVLTWEADELPIGTSQMDFAMGEKLSAEPVETPIALPDGRKTVLWSATPEQSLAWKLLWLNSDMYPQGKDLYDAVLLAEYRPFPVDLLRQTMTMLQAGFNHWEITEDHLNQCDFNWAEFQQEYPTIQGTEQEWLLRLITALQPAVAALDRPRATGPADS